MVLDTEALTPDKCRFSNINLGLWPLFFTESKGEEYKTDCNTVEQLD